MNKAIATAAPSSTDRARRAVLAEVKARADALDAPKAARLATSPDVGPAAPEAEVGRKAASPRPPKAAKAATKPTAKAPAKAKGKKKPVRPAPTAKRAPKVKPADRPLSGLDAAAKVLAGSGKPMRVSEMVEAMSAKGLWTSKAGKTPEATVYAAIVREIRDKGVESRFAKKDRGIFQATAEAKK
jgi:hypothetical protein